MTPSSCRQPGFQRGKGPGCVWANVFFVRSESWAGQRRLPEAHPDNEPLPTQATLGPDLPR